MAEPPPEEPVAGRFVELHEAGSGGMGTVYRARDTQTDRSVALKILSAATGDHLRFSLESDILQRLSHVGIVGYVAHGETSSQVPYLAMEWLEGTTLAERLVEGPLTVREAVLLGARVADALALAHANGVIHRDLKPSNLFLCDGRADQVKVLDFGVARLRENPRELTLTNQIVGTPGYMAPEQARGIRELDARVDLFALGCVLHRAISGEPAFDGPDVLSVLAKLVLHRPPGVGEIADGVPEELERLVLCLLEKSPRERPLNAEAVRDELLRISDLLERAGPILRRKPASPSEEPTLNCVVLARPENVDENATVSQNVFDDVERAGGHLQRLANGALLVDVEPGSSPEEQASRAAQCAHVLGNAFQGASIAIASGITERLERTSNGEVFDAASQLLGQAHGNTVRVKRPGLDSSHEGERTLHRHLLRALRELDLPLELAETMAAPTPRPEPSSSAALAATLPASARRSSGRSWLFGVVALVAVAITLVFAFTRPQNPEPAVVSPPAPLPTIVPSTTAAPVPPVPLREVKLAIVPRSARVTVDGEPRALVDGELSLRGEAGAAFEVVVASGGKTKRERVIIGRDGVASTTRIELFSSPKPDKSVATETKAPATPTVSVTATGSVPTRETW
jgi:serine/threonine protein kinase